jgi:hypothetical protein
MKNYLPALCVVAVGGAICATAVFIRTCSIADTKVFGVAQQNADTEVYRHSEAFREGTQRDFDELYLAYVKATPEEKNAIVATMRHRAEGVPPEMVPQNIKNLIGE